MLSTVSETVADGQALQAMDNSHVALVSLKLLAEQFESYRCDRNMPLGVNVRLSAASSHRLNLELTLSLRP